MTTRVLPHDEESIALAAETLRSGGVVAIPTETVYGLAGSALDEHAVATIFAAKERPTFDPLIVHIGAADGWEGQNAEDRLRDAEGWGVFDAARLSATARRRTGRLMEAFWPGPLTVVLPRHARIPLLVTSGLETVAVRMPRHPLAQAVLSRAAVPLAAPSANRFGRISPTTADDVLAELRGRIPYILDGGPCPVGLESTIVEIALDGALTLLRPGGVPAERIAEIAGVRPALAARRPGDRLVAPGMLDSHYAPGKPLFLLPGPARNLDRLPPAIRERIGPEPAGVGLLLFAGDPDEVATRLRAWLDCPIFVETLGRAGDLEGAARRLFGALRSLDASPVDAILSEPCPTEEGLGHAISDRLRRAAAR